MVKRGEIEEKAEAQRQWDELKGQMRMRWGRIKLHKGKIDLAWGKYNDREADKGRRVTMLKSFEEEGMWNCRDDTVIAMAMNSR